MATCVTPSVVSQSANASNRPSSCRKFGSACVAVPSSPTRWRRPPLSSCECRCHSNADKRRPYPPPMGRRAQVLFSKDSALRAPRLGQQLVIPVQHPDHTSVGLRAPNPLRSTRPPAHYVVWQATGTISSLVVAAGHRHFRFCL